MWVGGCRAGLQDASRARLLRPCLALAALAGVAVALARPAREDPLTALEATATAPALGDHSQIPGTRYHMRIRAIVCSIRSRRRLITATPPVDGARDASPTGRAPARGRAGRSTAPSRSALLPRPVQLPSWGSVGSLHAGLRKQSPATGSCRDLRAIPSRHSQSPHFRMTKLMVSLTQPTHIERTE